MSTDVVMPRRGESIAEGTITRWMKQVGERVERDEPLFEISTDKVDAEIPSPAAGTLTEIMFKEGETVEVNKVVAIIGAEGETSGAGLPRPAAGTLAEIMFKGGERVEVNRLVAIGGAEGETTAAAPAASAQTAA